MRVIIVVNTAWNLVNFRGGLIRSLVAAGHEVIAVAPRDSYAPQLAALGCRYVPFSMDNQGTHPGRDILLLLRFLRLFLRVQPDVVLGYTVKPNVYGSLAAHLLGVPVINNIAGLGAVFIEKSWVTVVVRALYRAALYRSHRVFFQNADDCRLFIDGRMVRPEVVALLPGSGIDLSKYAYLPPILEKKRKKPFRFLLIARMLWDKGVGEFVEAARLLRQRLPHVECCLLGFVDVLNPSAISLSQIEKWVSERTVRYLGVSEDVRCEIIEADCVVLPSYREGTPRSLLEAAAIGRPLVATDVVGCREVVDDGQNGFLCRVRDAQDLAEKMERMVLLSSEERMQMGMYGRRKMERQFDEKIVIARYLEVINTIKKKE